MRNDHELPAHVEALAHGMMIGACWALIQMTAEIVVALDRAGWLDAIQMWWAS